MDRIRRMANDLSPDEERALRPEVPANLANVRAVLVETKEPGNIGASARALNGMGITDLWVVNPQCDWQDSSEARKFAMNSLDVLRNAREAASLDEVLEDVHFLVGTTHRRRVRRLGQPVEAREAARRIAEISQKNRVAILFGREDFGLSNEALSRCNLIASIPMARRNPSLNLAQAVQIIAYEVFLASLGDVEAPPYKLATRRDVEALVHRVERLLHAVEFRPMNDDWEAIRTPLRRVVGRVPLERRDLEVLMKVCRDIENFIERKIPKPSD